MRISALDYAYRLAIQRRYFEKTFLLMENFSMKTFVPTSLALFSLLAAAACCLGVCLDRVDPLLGLTAIASFGIVFINAVYMIEG